MKAFILCVVLLTACSTRSKFEVLSTKDDVSVVRLTRSERNGGSATLFCAENARADFIRSSKRHASEAARTLNAIVITDGTISSNVFSARYNSILTGKIKYGPEPFEGAAVFDNSQFMIEAAAIQRSEDRLDRIFGGIAAGSLAASSAMQQSMAVQSQNASINRLSNSIDNNTNAINALPRSRNYYISR